MRVLTCITRILTRILVYVYESQHTYALVSAHIYSIKTYILQYEDTYTSMRTHIAAVQINAHVILRQLSHTLVSHIH
jgi:hypothetical protein